MSYKVLVADALPPVAVEIFERKGIRVDVKLDLSLDELKEIIADYDGVVVRSKTEIKDPAVFDSAKNLKVIGRAGSGVDNINVSEATRRGVLVTNTPDGNSNAAAEHTFAMMLSAARQIPAASDAMHRGEWNKKLYSKGIELKGKTLGVIGSGKIGSIVARRAVGFGMKVVIYDPYLNNESVKALRAEKAETLDDLLAQADFITLHTRLTDETRYTLDSEALGKCKKGVVVVNCARGGLVDEAALAEALKTGRVARAALDVLENEPKKDGPNDQLKTNGVVGMKDQVVLTPHEGAGTIDAQNNVAVQVAEQICAYLLEGIAVNAVNMPAVNQDAVPYMQLGKQLGLMAGQLIEGGIKKITIDYSGVAATLENTAPVINSVLEGIISPFVEGVTIVNAPAVAKERGIKIDEHKHDNGSSFKTLIRVDVLTDKETKSLAGSLFSGLPRLVDIDGVRLETSLEGNMLFVSNSNEPGVFAAITGAFAEAKVNIDKMVAKRTDDKKENVSLIIPEQTVPDSLVRSIAAIKGVNCARTVSFTRPFNGKAAEGLHL